MLAYRCLMGIAAPWLIGLTLVQRARGRLAAGALGQRLGFVPRTKLAPSLWLHGASNGELTSAEGVLRRLISARPGLQVLVTANTGTALAMVRGWGLPGVQAALSPLDSLGAPARVLRRWRPDALIVVENELWPTRLAAARAAGVPVALIGARMSDRSAAGWARVAPGLMRQMLQGLAFASAQDAGSAQRLQRLGLAPSQAAPVVMLKAQVPQASAPQMPQPVPRDRVLLAASTHPGEEALILQAFSAARGQFDLLILVPRHARRGAEVAGLIAAQGLTCTRRSAGASPAAGVPVFLGDTMGEMALWYRLAGVTVIGGSFVPLGGHTPYEPTARGSAVVHGPHMENFRDAAAALQAAQGAVAVTKAGLGAALAGLDAGRQAALAQAAGRALADGPGADALLDRLLALIPPAGQPSGSPANDPVARG